MEEKQPHPPLFWFPSLSQFNENNICFSPSPELNSWPTSPSYLQPPSTAAAPTPPYILANSFVFWFSLVLTMTFHCVFWYWIHCVSQGKPFHRSLFEKCACMQLTCKHTFQIESNQSRPHATTVSFIGPPHPGPLSTCPKHPLARYQTTRESLYAPRAHWNDSNQPIYTCPPCLTHSFPQKQWQRLLPTAPYLLPAASWGLQGFSTCSIPPPPWCAVPSLSSWELSNKLFF